MRPYLLDVNVLIALTWPRHVHHSLTQGWFAKHRKFGFRTCPLTQAGFVRINSNPKFHVEAVAPVTAPLLLEKIVSLEEHAFWPDDLTLHQALRSGGTILGHNQVVDAYLLALAGSKGGIAATLDRGLYAFSGADPNRVELLKFGMHQ